VAFADLCSSRGFVHASIGVVEGNGGDSALDVQGQFNLSLSDLRTAHTSTLPAVFASR
jgi:phosphoribosylformylglycinamidine synthase